MDIEQLKDKLQILEEKIIQLNESIDTNLMVAKSLQKALTPDQACNINGLTCFSKYQSSNDFRVESYNIYSSKDKKSIWFYRSMTGSFGLSSVLMDVLFQNKIQKSLLNNLITPKELVSVLINGLVEAKTKKPFRLQVSKLDLKTLTLNILNKGFPLPMVYEGEREKFSIKFPKFDETKEMENYLLPCENYTAESINEMHKINTQLSPGSRVLMFGNSWFESSSLNNFILNAFPENWTPKENLLSDINDFMLNANEHQKKSSFKGDVSVIGFEIDPKKLYIA